MRRRLIQLFVFLLLGAIINIAVAWGCVLNPWQAKQRETALDVSVELVWWRATAPEEMPEPTHVARLSVPGVNQDLLIGVPRSAANMPANASLVEESIRIRAGLPMRSLRGALFNYVLPPPDNKTTQQYNRLVRPPQMLVSKKIEYQRPLWPLAPIWPGFAINTVFYAAAVWLLFAAPIKMRRVLRHRRRIKRGLCPACAYPIGTSDVCTECGKPVTTTTQKAQIG